MEKTPAVKSAVSRDEIVVACAYQGHVADDVLAALPPGFSHVRYVAKFVDGVLVALQPGTPESSILQLLGVGPTDEHKPCEDGTCDDGQGAPKP
ncbi:MAG: hypothetical protein H6839_14060 [Planctomycetes bacterium]|nr:hypothetical protein [Planctomycetota bacterium]